MTQTELWEVAFSSEDEKIVKVPAALVGEYQGSMYLHVGCWGQVNQMRTTSNKSVLCCARCRLRVVLDKENEIEFAPVTKSGTRSMGPELPRPIGR